VRVVVGKIDGVRSVKVSLKEGVATIQFAPSNRATVAKIRDAIRSNGFSAREAEVQVAGSLVQRGDALALVIPGTDEVFFLQDAPGVAAMVAELRRRGSNARVVLTGQIPAPGARRAGAPARLLVRSFAAAS
jgi:copper chaperone CopZ